MATFSHGSSNLMLSLKVLLLSIAVFSVGVLLKLSLPVIMEFTLSDLPTIWSFIGSCLRPPYLYLVINCIIITIVASSKFQSQHSPVPDTVVMVRPEFVKSPDVLPADYAVSSEHEYGYGLISGAVKVPDQIPTNYVARPEHEYGYGLISNQIKVPADLATDYMVRPESESEYGFSVNSSVAKVPADLSTEYAVKPEYGYGPSSRVANVTKCNTYGNVAARISETETTTTVKVSDEMNGRDEIVISRPSLTPVRREPTEHSVSSHKPPYSARFAHRKSVKASPEGGKALRVSKPKRHDTLETTWKTITDGRAMPLTRHLRKSDTWDTQGRHHIPQFDDLQNQKMTKSETFNDRGSAQSNKPLLTPSQGSGKLRKEPSLSQDDLNRRVEAFINKFNEDMRLQRQESLNQYMEMINRGAH